MLVDDGRESFGQRHFIATFVTGFVVLGGNQIATRGR
jgi:hypothetical protein